MPIRSCDQCSCGQFATPQNSKTCCGQISTCPLSKAATDRIEERCLWAQGELRETDVPSDFGLAITLVRHIEEGVIPLFVETIDDAISTNQAQRILRRFLADSPVLVRSCHGEDLLQDVHDADQYLTPYLGMIA
ncbi:hypothetical protein JD969_12105 [Planctomycetota bacterium]|nr:hypothetical protein JD969_12105 [Planctomycetota bacterium]